MTSTFEGVHCWSSGSNQNLRYTNHQNDIGVIDTPLLILIHKLYYFYTKTDIEVDKLFIDLSDSIHFYALDQSENIVNSNYPQFLRIMNDLSFDYLSDVKLLTKISNKAYQNWAEGLKSKDYTLKQAQEEIMRLGRESRLTHKIGKSNHQNFLNISINLYVDKI